MTNNQTKCGIIYEKITMRAGDDERMINWPNMLYYMKIAKKHISSSLENLNS